MRALHIARMVLAASLLTWLADLAADVLQIGNPGLYFLIGIIASAGITFSAMACVLLWLRELLLRRRGNVQP